MSDKSKLVGRVINSNKFSTSDNLSFEHSVFIKNGAKNIPILLFYQNDNSVILGRGQFIDKEVNIKYCEVNEICINRRISGGGTVFQDKGNYNVSFIVTKKMIGTSEILKIYEFFRELIIESIIEQGYQNISTESYSNILFENKKISGSAIYIKGNNILFHATLLKNTNLELLEKSLKIKKITTEKRLSRYFPTINLDKLNIQEWQKSLRHLFEIKINTDLELSTFNKDEIMIASKLKKQIYKNHDWIYNGKRKLLQEEKTQIL